MQKVQEKGRNLTQSYYSVSRLSLNAGSLIQFCEVQKKMYLSYCDRSLYHWSALVRNETQQVRYNGASRTALQQSISDMLRCTFYNIYKLIARTVLHVFV